jgi:hypothetical protein
LQQWTNRSSQPFGSTIVPSRRIPSCAQIKLATQNSIDEKRKSCNFEVKMTLETINDEELAAKRAEPAQARALLPRIAGQNLSSLRRKILKLSGDQPASGCRCAQTRYAVRVLFADLQGDCNLIQQIY